MGRKPKPPWGELLGRPIERWFRRDDPRHGEAAENDAIAERSRKMLLLKKLYGANNWYNLVLKITSELDDALTIVDPPPRRTDEKAAKWRGAEGLQFLDEFDALREAMEAKVGHEVCVEAVLAEHQEVCERYSKMKPDVLKKNYYEALRHHRKSTKLRTK